MKYIIILALVFIGCDSQQKTLVKNIEVIEYDSCEYIGYYIGYQAGLLTHKGNCKYCLQRAKNK